MKIDVMVERKYVNLNEGLASGILISVSRFA